MNLQYLKKIIKLVNESEIDEVEIEEEGTKIRITRKNSSPSGNAIPLGYLPYQFNAAQLPTLISSPSLHHEIPQKEKPVSVETPSTLHEIKSPIVGTFYRAPAQDAEPYIQVGQVVSKGSVLCIIEAMKLMNEIESDTDGKVVNILVENGQPVEYNQSLFLIEQT